MSLKVMCLQLAVYLSLESSRPDTRLMGLTPHIQSQTESCMHVCYSFSHVLPFATLCSLPDSSVHGIL